MPTLIKRIFHRPAIRFGMESDSRGRFRDPRFVSFIAESNRKTLNTDFQDAILRGRKLLRYALVAAVVCGAAWVVLESAHALSMF
ncbi:MAG: hypothetical protein ABSH26_11100 [Opitutaceae bacterium]|jgi:hypothetical protein